MGTTPTELQMTDRLRFPRSPRTSGPRARSAFAISAAALGLGVLALVPLRADAQERHVLTGSQVTLWNLAGEVRVEAGTGADVVVELTRGGSDGRRLDVVASGGELRVRYPSDEVVYRSGVGNGRGSTTVNVRSDGTFGGDWRGGGRRTTVRTSGSGLDAHANLVLRVPPGKRLEVNLALGRIEVVNVSGELRFDVAAAEVIARGTKGSLVVDAGSGSVRVEDAEGDLEVDTGSGSTTLLNVRGPRVVIDAGSGGLTARGVTTDRLSADIGSGSVSIEGLSTDDLMVDTGSGSVRVELTKVPRRTNIDTGSGSVTLTLPAGANAELDLDTSSGGISSDFAVTMNEVRRRSLRGRIGEGGPIIRVSTGSGSVRVLKR